jgi:hypothetical protein
MEPAVGRAQLSALPIATGMAEGTSRCHAAALHLACSGGACEPLISETHHVHRRLHQPFDSQNSGLATARPGNLLRGANKSGRRQPQNL